MSSVSQKLHLTQTQNLVMTPQLQQAIRILQLSNVELNDYLDEEMTKNPLLERDERSPDADVPGDGDKPQDDGPQASPKDESISEQFDEAWTGNENDARSGAEDFSAGATQYGTGGGTSFDPLEGGFEERMSEAPTLREHLLEQLYWTTDEPRDRMIGALLIDRLDGQGYLREDPADLAMQLGCSSERVERLLAVMKGFDPTGIFARDLDECLALQLAEQNRLDAPMQALLDHLDLLAKHDLETLAVKCGVNATYLSDMIAEIRALNPRPAGNFEHFVVQTAIPDVLMRALPKTLGGGWRVELNTETLPKVLVNNTYYTEVAKSAGGDRAARQYLENNLQAANWLVRALDQRAQTITKVAGEIVEQQQGFFLYGVEYLKPLTLRDIAETVEMHESTVSRVTANKYIGTPRGIFELKYFFTTALAGADGQSHSAEAVRARVRAMIDAEAPDAVLSDDQIVEALKSAGIDIARRTVAKYREALGIPSSVQRRRQKKA